MQFGQSPVQWPTRAQGFGRVEMRGSQHQVAVRGARRDAREVEGEAFGQGHRRVGGERIDADQALRMGMVTEVLPDEQLPAATEKLLQRLTAGPALAMGIDRFKNKNNRVPERYSGRRGHANPRCLRAKRRLRP